MEKKRNRNAIRSVNMIMQAYSELLSTTPSEKITVTSIVNKAGLNRSTFYAHFSCPNDVYKLLERKLVDELLDSIDSIIFKGLLRDPEPLLQLVTDRIEKNMDYVKLMFIRYPMAEWMENIRDAVVDKLMSDMETADLYEERDMLMINLRFFVGGYIALCRDYIAGKIEKSPAELVKPLARTISAGLVSGMKNSELMGDAK